MSRVPTHLLRLGLTSMPSSRAEISAAYRNAALKHHPDKGGNALDFAALTDSYHYLMRTLDPSFHPAHHGAYRPASLRSFVDAQRDEPSPFAGILTAIVVPSLVGVIVGLRMIYLGGERTGLRAGGVSKFKESDHMTTSKEHILNRQDIENRKHYFQQQQQKVKQTGIER